MCRLWFLCCLFERICPEDLEAVDVEDSDDGGLAVTATTLDLGNRKRRDLNLDCIVHPSDDPSEESFVDGLREGVSSVESSVDVVSLRDHITTSRDYLKS